MDSKEEQIIQQTLKSKKHMIQLFSSWQFFSIARRLWSQSSKISGELSLLLLWLLQWPKYKQSFLKINFGQFWEFTIAQKWTLGFSNLLEIEFLAIQKCKNGKNIIFFFCQLGSFSSKLNLLPLNIVQN